ncbi:MAG: aerial mycelium formation protein [Actinobacteria bacterium]|nr:aerial mycelium formation protein [Actinomycetota bacterium]MBW3648999.1 aerial mycelium formation protein [Actinomycetota bacterium]
MPSQRLDRVLDDEYVEGLQALPTGEIRARRGECQTVETDLSYARRLVQGRLDIIHAEIERRSAAGSPSDAGALVDTLKDGTILSDHGRPSGLGRLSARLAPSEEVDEFIAEIEEVADTDALANLPDLSDDVVSKLADRLAALERSFSARRREVFDRIDLFQGEIIRRYKTGSANPEELLT